MTEIRRGPVWSRLVRLLSVHPIPFEEERKRLLFASVTLLGTIMLVGFGSYHLVMGPRVEGVVDLAVALVLAMSIWRLRQLRDARLLYRTVMVVVGLLFVFFGSLGDHGHRAVWIFSLPAFALFVAGARFGTALSLVVLGAWLLVFTLPTSWTGAYDYDVGFATRFTASYVTILLLSLFAEQVRRRYSEAMQRHQEELRAANADLALAEQHMRELAMEDALTRIPNRRSILSHLESEARRLRREGGALTVAFLDIDRFKRINDAHGHGVGDAVLTECAERIGGSLRAYDRVGRYGGEEFLLVLTDAVTGDGSPMLERVRRAVADRPFQAASVSLEVTVSIGTATASGDAIRVDELIARADRALYRAKENGRNRVLADGGAAL